MDWSPKPVSPVVALTDAVLLSMLPLTAFTLTTMVTVGVVAAPTWPRSQVTVAFNSEQVPWLAVDDLYFSPVGRVSVTVTPVASDAPSASPPGAGP